MAECSESILNFVCLSNVAGLVGLSVFVSVILSVLFTIKTKKSFSEKAANDEEA